MRENIKKAFDKSFVGGFGEMVAVTSCRVLEEGCGHFLAGLSGGLRLPTACCLAACTLALLCCLSAFCFKDINNMDIDFRHSYKMKQHFS